MIFVNRRNRTLPRMRLFSCDRALLFQATVSFERAWALVACVSWVRSAAGRTRSQSRSFGLAPVLFLAAMRPRHDEDFTGVGDVADRRAPRRRALTSSRANGVRDPCEPQLHRRGDLCSTFWPPGPAEADERHLEIGIRDFESWP
jgi:hypothetical protein